MKKSAIAIIAAILAFVGALPCSAQNQFARPAGKGGIVRSDSTPIVWYFDGRDDNRDFPTNGFFPGDFAANPAGAAIGAAGIFGSTPSHGSHSRMIDASLPDQNYCARRFRSYDPASGTFIGYDGLRHRCR